MLISTLLSFLFLIPVPVHADPLITIVTIDPPVLPVAPQVLPVALLPAMKPICGCESAGSPTKTPIQFNPDGSVLHGRIHYPDTGSCQLNGNVWRASAEALGYDIDTRDGNYAMANHIYQMEGTRPWNPSRSCWQ